MKTRIPTEIVKVLAGHLRESNSPEQEKLFAEWLAVPGNDAEYRKFLKVWNEIVDAETPDFDINNAWSELNRRLAAERGASLFSSRFVRIVAGIAAAQPLQSFRYSVTIYMNRMETSLSRSRAFPERAVSAFRTEVTSLSMPERLSHTENISARRTGMSWRKDVCSSMWPKIRKSRSSFRQEDWKSRCWEPSSMWIHGWMR